MKFCAILLSAKIAARAKTARNLRPTQEFIRIMNFLKIGRYIFLFEALVVNGGVALLCFFSPATFLVNFSPSLAPAPALEIVRWYGVLLSVLSVMVLRALPANDDRVLRPSIEALLFGDLLHLVASYLFFQVVPVWNAQFFLMIGMTIFLASVRITWLYLLSKTPKHVVPLKHKKAK